ncbi:fumarylacetoacetate hydrolase family protein [Pararcticibacter amylolyticus]|uniref:Fumarylacetoacetate hydrolase n=1 Tax=Pararcticibacter amylolyticus TaxID=2173175 RepID=A0A2U2PFN5_9SPHI|nr:fumarylacetoacetate hydrolase family protein [Pararcticibacter amylolyticus]PWG80217.1 fumarylacetoacetate hydrolase [Pararcticibacter amylolyticus]
MKLVSYKHKEKESLGIIVNGSLYDLHGCDPLIPQTMFQFLNNSGPVMMPLAGKVQKAITASGMEAYRVDQFNLMAPVPRPSSCRDAYAFRQHVASARRNRGLGMLPEFDQYPVFYFTNHHSVTGPGPVECMPDHFEQLDFELEVAVVIGKAGKNIRAEEADDYIAGYMIMNDLSARTLQMEEMLLSLGPAKGKDFATATGPWLVTPDELEPYLIAPQEGHTGRSYALDMVCRVNGHEVSRGNTRDMNWTFAEIIERCAYGTEIFPGDIIGSGTVGTGCFLELNGTAKLKDPAYQPVWLKEGDVVEMEITGLGILQNTITRSGSDFSILKRKKAPCEVS